MRWGLFAAVAAAVLALAPAALADDLLTLAPVGGGADTYTSWLAQQGQSDSVGTAEQALYFHHGGAAPAAAFVRGLEGRPVSALFGLSWERRNDSICTTNDPRWTLALTTKSGKQYVVRFGCAASAHSAGNAFGWTRDTNTQATIRARILKATADREALTGTIGSLAIVVDKARGDAWLDNVQVLAKTGSQTWTCAADNGYTPPKPPGLTTLDVDQTPWTDAEQTPAEDLLAGLTPDEQYAISDDGLAAASAP